jgi:hypothetical protein
MSINPILGPDLARNYTDDRLRQAEHHRLARAATAPQRELRAARHAERVNARKAAAAARRSNQRSNHWHLPHVHLIPGH